MAPIDHPDLPLLTDIVNADGTPVRIPMLTDIVPSDAIKQTVVTPVDSIADMASKLVWHTQTESGARPAAGTERNISETEMQRLLDHFEAHLESVFTDKLNRHLQQLHHQAVKLAILDLKKELPELLRNALNQPDLKK